MVQLFSPPDPSPTILRLLFFPSSYKKSVLDYSDAGNLQLIPISTPFAIYRPSVGLLTIIRISCQRRSPIFPFLGGRPYGNAYFQHHSFKKLFYLLHLQPHEFSRSQIFYPVDLRLSCRPPDSLPHLSHGFDEWEKIIRFVQLSHGGPPVSPFARLRPPRPPPLLTDSECARGPSLSMFEGCKIGRCFLNYEELLASSTPRFALLPTGFLTTCSPARLLYLFAIFDARSAPAEPSFFCR